MSNLLPIFQNLTTRAAVSTFDGDAVSLQGSVKARCDKIPLGSFSKAVLSLTMRHDREFLHDVVTMHDGAIDATNSLLCHQRIVPGSCLPVYRYDDERFRAAVDHYIARRGLSRTDLPMLIKETLGMRVDLVDESRPERGLICSHFDLHHMLRSIKELLQSNPPSAKQDALFHLGDVVSTPQLSTGSPFFWSQEPAFILQHGGIVDRSAVLLLLAPQLQRGFVVSLDADDPVAAQVRLSEIICDDLDIPIGTTSPHPCPEPWRPEKVEGRYVDGRHHMQVRIDAGHLVLQTAGGPERICHQVGPKGFADVDSATPPRYAHTLVTEPGPDRRVVAMVIDQRTYIRLDDGGPQ